MDLTESFTRLVPADVRARYDWLEVRNAAAVLAASDPVEFADLLDVLRTFVLDEKRDLLDAGGNETAAAGLLNRAFKARGWREGDYATRVTSQLRLLPWGEAGETTPRVEEREADTASFLIDNLKGRVAIDVEWHAKEGHLDRDFAAYRSLYQQALIDAACVVTVRREELRRRVRELDPRSTKFATSTTTSVEKAAPRLVRGDGGGCPLLVVGICGRTV